MERNYHLKHPVMPHSGEAAVILAGERDQLNALTRFLLNQPPIAELRASQRFRTGLRQSRWITILSGPRGRTEAARSRREASDG